MQDRWLPSKIYQTLSQRLHWKSLAWVIWQIIRRKKNTPREWRTKVKNKTSDSSLCGRSNASLVQAFICSSWTNSSPKERHFSLSTRQSEIFHKVYKITADWKKKDCIGTTWCEHSQDYCFSMLMWYKLAWIHSSSTAGSSEPETEAFNKDNINWRETPTSSTQNRGSWKWQNKLFGSQLIQYFNTDFHPSKTLCWYTPCIASTPGK